MATQAEALETLENFELPGIDKLERDVRAAATHLGPQEGRFLVDTYYTLQEYRKALRNQQRASAESGEPNRLIVYFADQIHSLERLLPSILGRWAKQTTPGEWSQRQVGIGPVLSAGLVAHIDITKAPTAGSIWRFAGLDPEVKWEKGQKRPWNADLKVLCYRIGDSFVKQSHRENCFYGQLYRQRKAYEVERDEMQGNAATAARTLQERNIQDKTTRAIYEEGHLPPGRLDMRARRWAVKMFLAGYHEVAYVGHYDKLPPAPYPIAHLGHAHEIAPPDAPEVVRRLRQEAGR